MRKQRQTRPNWTLPNFSDKISDKNMSWTFQRPDGAEGMAPSISHEQLLCNRDALERKLSQRGPRDELVNRGIMPAVSAAPAILSQRTKLERAKTGDILQKKFRGRPNRAQLIQRHILTETPGAVDPSLIDKQMRLKRKKLEDDLNDKLSIRPGPLELVKENILEAGTAMGQAVQEGTVPFTETTQDYLDTMSPDSQGSPEQLSSPEPSQVLSPPNVSSPLSSTSITSSVQALVSLQAQTKKQTLQQQKQQQQQHQLFLQQQNGPQVAQPSQLLTQVPTQVSKKEGRSRKKATKPKVKKYKYHEYRPPNGEVQKCDLPSDSPYGLLLQQQQLYLQLQVLYQNYPHHCLLPSIPENIKLAVDVEKPVRIEDMRVIDMRRALKDQKLPVFGSKTDLIKRLKDAELAKSQGVAVSSSNGQPLDILTQGITTTAPSVSQAQAVDKAQNFLLQRSNSVPVQPTNLDAVHQLQMQILANHQSLQQLNVPPEVQQQLQQLNYLNLQSQLKQMNLQQQQNIQPKPQEIPLKTETVCVKKEEPSTDSCSFGGTLDQRQTLEKASLSQKHLASPLSRTQDTRAKHLDQHPDVAESRVDHVDEALAHLQEQAELLDLHSQELDSNPSSVESQVLRWEQQHPLFDGETDSYPSPGSHQSDVSELSPLQVDQLSRSMDALQNINFVPGSVKSEHQAMQRSYSERSPSSPPDDMLLMAIHTKPRSLSEPQFPNSHKRSLSFPNVPFSTPPPSYEAHMAAQSQKQRNSSLAGQSFGGHSVQSQKSCRQEDIELSLNPAIQDRELTQELHKAMLKNPVSLNHDEILEILGDPGIHQPVSSGSFVAVSSPSHQSHGSLVQSMNKSPSFGFLGFPSPPAHSMPGRISKSCEDVSHVPFGNKTFFQVDNNALSDLDTIVMSPLSPMKVDSCEADEDSGLLFHSSDSIPIPAPNGNVARTDNLGWLDLSITPPHQNASHSSVGSMHNSYKGTPPSFLYDPVTTFKVEEPFHLSLFDLETSTSLHPPSDFSEAMDYCV